MKKKLLKTLALVFLVAIFAAAPGVAEATHEKGHRHTGDHRHMPSMTTIPLTIEGMTCVKCEKKVEDALSGLDGIKSTSASFKDGEAIVKYDPEKVSKGKIVETLTKAGYKATSKD